MQRLTVNLGRSLSVLKIIVLLLCIIAKPIYMKSVLRRLGGVGGVTNEAAPVENIDAKTPHSGSSAG